MALPTGPFVPETEIWECPLDSGKVIAISKRKLNFPASRYRLLMYPGYITNSVTSNTGSRILTSMLWESLELSVYFA